MKNFIERIKIKIFADGAKKEDILLMNSLPYINGFTTNPTLMRKAGIHSYEDFSKEILATVQEKPLSLEVFSDDFNEMEKQARKIYSWGKNVYVKIPITNTKINLQNNPNGYYTDKECAFASVGAGLTDAEAANFYTLVQAYQTTLGRAV